MRPESRDPDWKLSLVMGEDEATDDMVNAYHRPTREHFQDSRDASETGLALITSTRLIVRSPEEMIDGV